VHANALLLDAIHAAASNLFVRVGKIEFPRAVCVDEPHFVLIASRIPDAQDWPEFLCGKWRKWMKGFHGIGSQETSVPSGIPEFIRG
jgi:hypothetical protein